MIVIIIVNCAMVKQCVNIILLLEMIDAGAGARK